MWYSPFDWAEKKESFMIEQRVFDFDKKERVSLENGLREPLVYLMAQLLVGYWKTTPGAVHAARDVFSDRGAERLAGWEPTVDRSNGARDHSPSA